MTGPETIASCAAVGASIGGLTRALRGRRPRVVGLALLLTGWAALVLAIAPAALRDHALLLIGAALVVLAAGWLVAGLLVGRERWLLVTIALFLTLRLPVPTGDGSAMLLAPLYVVIALGTLVLVRSELRDLRDPAAARAIPARGGATRLIDVAAALLPAIATLSLTWSIDRSASAEDLTFFLVPFLLLYALVRSWVRDVADLRGAARTLVGAALVAALVGIYQAVAHVTWWNPKVINANRFRADFRVNSIFWDPNIHGRALVVALLAIAAWMLVTRLDRRRAVAGLAAITVLVVALWNTYSQSSWFALGAALAVIGALTLPPRLRRWVAAAIVVALVAGAVPALHALSGADAEGRGSVAALGIDLARERPVLGWGFGSFTTAATELALRDGDAHPKLVASHTTPITVVAELGILGALAYLTLLGGAALAASARWARPTAGDWPVAPVIWATGTLVALVAHSLLYAGFFEDATLWVALAVLASLPPVTPEQGPTT